MRRRTFLQTLAVAFAVPWTRLLAPAAREPLMPKPSPDRMLYAFTIDLAMFSGAGRQSEVYAFGTEMMLEDLLERSDG